MKIAIFGGSFNPVHKGHIEIAKYAIEKLSLDKLVFVPSYKSPFKSKKSYANSEDRVNMLNLVIPKKSEISYFEINRKGTSYTIDTIKYFRKKYPKSEIFLLIGTDNLSKLHKWKNIEEISSMAKITIFKRSFSYSKENIKKFNCILLDNDLHLFSSTKVRGGAFSDIDPKVKEYIGEKFLYIKDILFSMLDSKRHKHSISVGDYAAKYAKVVGYDPKKAWVAGVLHDITKSQPKEWHRDFLSKRGITNLKDYQLHSKSGYFWVKDEYGIKDTEILNSILVHTSLSANLNILDKIVYAADKLADGRKYNGIQKDRELILSDFENGFKKIVRVTYEHLKKYRDIDEEQEKIYERWM